MASKSTIERNSRVKRTVAKYAELRKKLKEEGNYAALTQLPRDASPVRLVNRCEVTGRRQAYMRKFRCSRLVFREAALAGLIPGITKASW